MCLVVVVVVCVCGCGRVGGCYVYRYISYKNRSGGIEGGIEELGCFLVKLDQKSS